MLQSENNGGTLNPLEHLATFFFHAKSITWSESSWRTLNLGWKPDKICSLSTTNSIKTLKKNDFQSSVDKNEQIAVIKFA